jgi:hypothetical protein
LVWPEAISAPRVLVTRSAIRAADRVGLMVTESTEVGVTFGVSVRRSLIEEQPARLAST